MSNLNKSQRAVPAADATTNVDHRDVAGNKADAGVQTVGTAESLMALVKGMLDILSGTAGITAFPTAAAPGNAISLAEVLRQVHDQTVGARRLAIGNWNFGDDGGADPTTQTIFTVTGDVLMAVFGIAKAAVTSGGTPTIELGVSGATAALISQIVDATDLAIDEIWHSATPTLTVEQLGILGSRDFVISNGQDVIYTIGGAAITAGDINFYGLWVPLSTNGDVVAP